MAAGERTSGAPGAGNADAGELARFDAMAQRWWDPQGPSRPLHDLNPVRLEYIRSRVPLAGAEALDVGCGGGLLSEAMARAGARVTAIDLAPELIDVARLHLLETQLAEPTLSVDYQQRSAEDLAGERAGSFDVVTCMELLEHVPDPAALLQACVALLRPGGTLFVSTLNRTPRAFALAVLGAEYVLRLLPRGTHRYAQFIRPSELGAWLRAAGAELRELHGLAYDPFGRSARIVADVSVNYIGWAIRRE